VEARWKATGRFELALFVDAGNVTPEIEDWYRFEGMGYGVGAGLRYMLPVGPVRLDGAINPDPGPLDSDGALHLTVGLSF
jgi:outer membrane translocation and assembly module TamA